MLESLINESERYLFDKLLPQWQRHGIHPELAYSVESLNDDWTVNPVGRIRLLTQCRQLYTFSHAYIEMHNTQWQTALTPLFDFIVEHYWIDDAWIFSLHDDLSVNETYSDSYALAFVLLSFSYYYQATKDKRALLYIERTHVFLNQQMKCHQGGFLECFPAKQEILRKQNPHMHLLEGYLAAYQVDNKATYKAAIKHLLDLMCDYFFDASSNSLIEYFDQDWSVHNSQGHCIEPGHHFEWIWLLDKASKVFPEQRYADIADLLWQKAKAHGFDPKGGIYNQIDAASGKVIDPEKRIWPMTEYLKALCVQRMRSSKTHEEIADALGFLLKHYLKKDGRWNEYLDANNKPTPHPLPGTTSYHIFLGLLEVLTWAKNEIKA